MEQSFDRREAVFNAALGFTIRLNHILNNCYKYRASVMPFEWFHELIALKMEIWCKMDKKTRADLNNMIFKLKPSVDNRFQSKLKSKSGTGMSTELYNGLMELELLLRDEADKVGLINPNKKTIWDGMGKF